MDPFDFLLYLLYFLLCLLAELLPTTLSVLLYLHTILPHILLLAAHFPLGAPHSFPVLFPLPYFVSDFYLTLLPSLATLLWWSGALLLLPASSLLLHLILF